MNNQFDYQQFVGGIPVKSSQATKDTMDGKAFRIGYQTAKLANERQQLDQDRMSFEQEKAAIIQQLLSAQAQFAATQGARAGAVAGMSAGLGYAGLPVGPGGELPPPPSQMGMGAAPPMGGGAMPPMGGGPPMPMM
jgi:hypothetical protein